MKWVPLLGAGAVLPPSVVRLTASPTPTANYDRTILSGYALDPLSGVTHSQEGVMYQNVKA